MQDAFSIDEIRATIERIDPANNTNFYTLDDSGNGCLFHEVSGRILLYNVTSKGWMYHDGSRWRPDPGNVKAMTAAEALQKVLYVYAVNYGKEYQRHVYALGSINTRDRMLRDASKHGAITSEQLDQDNRYLNVANGTLNLETMELQPHDPAMLLSKVAGASYEPGVRSAVWEQFLDQIMIGDADRIDYLQRALGYAVIGKADEDCLFVFYGATTRNGKSTLLRSIGSVLGDYAVILPPDALAARQRNADAPSENLADLRGSRLVHIEEPSRQMAFDAGLLKQMTGGTMIKTRRCYETSMTFPTTFVCFMSANYLPRVDDMTLFTSNRLRVIPFERHFEPSEQDHNLRDKLAEPEVKSAILNWLLEGLQKYRERGLTAPDSITHATAEYMKMSDKLGSFVSDELVKDQGKNIPASKVYTRYDEWCRLSGYRAENKGHFLDMLRRRGFLAKTGTVNGRTVHNVVKGYRLRTSADEVDDEVGDDDDIPF